MATDRSPSSSRQPAWLARLPAGPRSLFARLARMVGPPSAADSPAAAAGRGPSRSIDPEILARVAMSPLLARTVVEGFLNGLHRSPYHGFSVEFADHREYVPGDDLKHLDWALFARTDNYYTKRYEEETNLRCHILLDSSNSMAFGSGRITKWDYACFLATCLAYLMIKQKDAVGLALFGAGPGVILPPRCRTSHLRQMMMAMARTAPQGRTDVAGSIRSLLHGLKRRGLVVVISDLIDDPEETLACLRLLRSHRHDVIVFHVQDAAEIEFGFEAATVFRDMETGAEMEIDPVAVRSGYVAEMERLVAFYRKGLTEVGIDYQPVSTRSPCDQALAAYLGRRARGRIRDGRSRAGGRR